MKSILNKYRELLSVLVIFIISVLLVNPFGNYAVNDDWDFYTHVRNFTQGNFIKNAFIDSAFVLQGLVGMVWSLLFGLSFNSLRILTILVTGLFIVGLYKVLNLLKINKLISTLSILSIVLYPFVFMSSMTFMTEIYFLTFMVWGIYYMLLYFENSNSKNFYLAIIIASASILIRQLGFLVVPVILLGFLLHDLKNKKKLSKSSIKYIFGLLIFIVFTLVLFFWPQYYDKGSKSLFFIVNASRSIRFIPKLFMMFVYSLPYFGLIFLPFSFYSFSKLNKWLKIVAILVPIILFQTFYKVDIFKFGNVLYPEGLMIRSNYIKALSLFDNLTFKVILNFMCLFSFVNFLLLLVKERSLFKETKVQTLSILWASLTLPVLIYDGFYDRYLINGLVVSLIISSIFISNISTNKVKKSVIYFTYFLMIFYILYSFSLVQSFFVTTKIQWKHAEKVQQERDPGNKLFLNSTYTKFNYVFPKKNDANLTEIKVSGITYECYVQRQVKNNKSNPVYSFLNRIETSRSVNIYFINPKPSQSEYLSGFRFPTKDMSKVLYLEEYISIPDFLVGNKTEIISYCENNKKEPN